MERFTRLFVELDSTTRTSQKLDALRRYFREAPPRDAAWALTLLAGGKLTRAISSRRLRDWVSQETGYPHWLLGECYEAAGDLAEALALLLPDPGAHPQGGTVPPRTCALCELVEARVLPLPKMSESEQRATVTQTWKELDMRQRFLYHKMIMGSFRVGVAARLVIRALAQVAGVEPGIIAHRLAGQWQPTAEAFQQLLQPDHHDVDPARPYPFCLAHPLDRPLEDLGDPSEWQAEWKWDGIRAQLVHRPGHVLVWSRGDEVITPAFPEIAAVARALAAGTVLDGEILAWEDNRPLPFAMLQRRINRKREEPRLFEEIPVVFMAFDVLEHEGHDLRGMPLAGRRDVLEILAAGTQGLAPSRHFRVSPAEQADQWTQVRERHQLARELGAEGLMLKRVTSAYAVGRKRGEWWKWKVDPYTIDAVLIYAQLGNGKRANIFTDYTFGLWNQGELVPVAKAYSGLTDEEIRQVDAFIRHNTIDRHGPVRVVRPELVFELAFENIQVSNRHKSGLAVRFPRMARWRQDKKADEADTLDALRALASTAPAPRRP